MGLKYCCVYTSQRRYVVNMFNLRFCISKVAHYANVIECTKLKTNIEIDTFFQSIKRYSVNHKK